MTALYSSTDIVLLSLHEDTKAATMKLTSVRLPGGFAQSSETFFDPDRSALANIDRRRLGLAAVGEGRQGEQVVNNNYGLGGIFKPKNSSRFSIRYSVNGKQFREWSVTTSEAKAKSLLKKRLGEIEAGGMVREDKKKSLYRKCLTVWSCTTN